MEMRKLYICQPFNDVSEEDFNMVRKTILDSINEGITTIPYELIDLKCGINTEKTDGEYQLLLLAEALEQIRKADLIVFAPEWNKSEHCVALHLICELYPSLYEKWLDFEQIYL